MPSLRGGSNETLPLLWVVFASPCRIVGPGKLGEKETDELRTKYWKMRERSLGSMLLLKTRLGRLPFSVSRAWLKKRRSPLGCHTILLKAVIGNRGEGPARVWGYTVAVQRHDFVTAVMTEDHRNCGGQGRLGIVLEPSAMPSSDRSIAMHFYFHILKPLGPAPKFCVQNAFSLHVCKLERSGPNHGSQAGQDTAGKDMFSGKGGISSRPTA